MSVTTKIHTNASIEEIKEAVKCHINDVRELDDDIYEVYMDNYDNYTLLPEDANEMLSCNLIYKKPYLWVKILETRLH